MKKSTYLLLAFFMFLSNLSYSQESSEAVNIENSKISVTVFINQDGELLGDSIFAKTDWSKGYGKRSFGATTDAGFKLDIMWSAWSAPGKEMFSKTVAPGGTDNADNLINLTQQDFEVVDHKISDLDDGGQALVLMLKGRQAPLEVRVTYKLGPDHFYARRKLEVKVLVPETPDTFAGQHYLRRMWPIYAVLKTNGTPVKQGGFGQPVALQLDGDRQTGLFWGMEYPTAQNELIKDGSGLRIEIGDYYGAHIGMDWTTSDWVVIGLSPQADIRQWFMNYIDDIRAQPLRPYLLYNSWYDLQDSKNVDSPKRALNEENVLSTIKLIQQELTEKRGVALDGFVLDDGWDVYQSDWKISEKQFPNGFRPLVDQLNVTNTNLGIWFSPMGGYSNSRWWRLELMKGEGYEVIGENQLCIAGENYHDLLKSRIKDFTKNRNVGYYKWDGIQFVCNNTSHGHPIDVYSRRAIMDSVIDLGQTVWGENPDAFLNITSGTWLSPWWVKYATTIWMQGGDYGFTNTPSISHRDRAITFRDLVLYDNFKNKELWFPISNLMTVGVIKGKLHSLSEKEALDKFTDNALLSYTRGVAMWGLYISPEILTSDEWDVLAQGAKWARDRFDILKHTVMIGGDPGKGEAYGYAHFKDDRGVIVVRNPAMAKQNINITMNGTLGLSNDADSLVVEQMYPHRWISRMLYTSGDSFNIDLQGYETAIYEIFPLKETDRPLLAGAIFESEKTSAGYQIKVLNISESDGGAHFLNPEAIRKIKMNNQDIKPDEILFPSSPFPSMVNETKIKQVKSKNSSTIIANIDVDESVQKSELSVLLQASSKTTEDRTENPKISISIDGKSKEISSEEMQGLWGFYSVSLPSGSGDLTIEIQLDGAEKSREWSGSMSLWIIGDLKVNAQILDVFGSNSDITFFPPTVRPENTIRQQKKLGELNINFGLK